jgi:hypothetical protein
MVGGFIHKLPVADDVEVMVEYDLGNVKNQTFSVRAMDQQRMNGHAAWDN